MVGALLIETAFHQTGRPRLTLFCAAGALIALSALSEGTLGVLRLVPVRVHRLVDFAVVLALAASPLAYWRDLSLAPVLASEASALLLWRTAALTRYRQPVKQEATSSRPEAAGQAAPGTTSAEEESGAAPGTRARAAGPASSKPGPARREPPTTAWTLGVLAARLRGRYPQMLDDEARRLGTTIGKAVGKRPRQGGER